MIRISIVTVCYNAGKTIEHTIKSIINQSYNNIEYIIIDGDSSDNTKFIIEKHLKDLQALKRFVFISESDKGIYDAMNKAIKLATGDWIIFMNADDTFYNDSIIEDIFENINKDFKYDVLYGDTNLISRYEESIIMKSDDLNIINKQMPFSHQSVFVKKNILMDNLFDLKYKICADYKFFMLMYMQNKKFYYTKLVISNFSTDGISGTAKLEAKLETMKIQLELKPNDINWFGFYIQYIKLNIIFYLKSRIFGRIK